jgi:hypothetical protein
MLKNNFINYNFLLYLCIFSITSIFTVVFKNGDLQYGFSSVLLPLILYDPLKKSYYVAVSDRISNDAYYTYGLSCTNEKNGKFVPLLVSKALVNNVLMDNPIYGVGFSNLALVRINGIQGARYVPAVVVNDENPLVSKSVYVLIRSRWIGYDKNIILSTLNLNDKNGDSGKILSIQTMQNGLCAFVCNSGKSFGESGCAGVLYGYVPKEVLQKAGNSYVVISSMDQTFKKTFDETINAFKIDDSGTINFDSTQNPCLFGDPDLNSVYIGVSGSSENGICAVTNYDVPIVQSGAINEDSIIATKKKDKKICIKNISTMHTSTGLFYLIAQAGDDDTSLNNIYSMPLINDPTSENFGNLAKVKDGVQVNFSLDLSKIYYNSVLSSVPSEVGDLYSDSDLSAKVGGGPLTFNDKKFKIISIQTQRDSVIVQALYDDGSIDESVMGGLFYSQAIFDSNGLISSWTPWQRKTFFFNSSAEIYAPTNGHFLCLDSTNKSVLETIWNNNSGQFSFLKNEKNLPIGGIQGVIDIPYQHPAVGEDSNGFKSSYAFLLGYQTVILMQTSKNSSLTPFSGEILNCSSGDLSNFDSNKNYGALIMTGGALSCDSNALICAEMAYSDLDCWPIVCGSAGIFVLMNDDGTGCGNSKLGVNFGNFKSTFKWNKLSQLSIVKKIIPMKGWIFVLTNDSLYKIEALEDNFSKKEGCSIIKVASIDNFSNKENECFSDFLVSGNSCLLATSCGLFRNSNNSIFLSTENNLSFYWDRVILPETKFPPIYLYPISRSGYQNDWANDSIAQSNDDISAGNIYVLAGSIGTHETLLYRLVTYDSSVDGIEDDSIRVLENYFIENIPSYYVRFSSGQFSIVGDGASWYTHEVKENPISFRGSISLLPSYLKQGLPFAINEMFNVANSPNYSSFLGPVTYISGYGVWIAPHSSGVLVLS